MMDALKWARSPLPAECGWYWVRAETKKDALGRPYGLGIVHVLEHRSGWGEIIHSIRPDPREMMAPYEWAGPIPAPQEV